MCPSPSFREPLVARIRREANPPDKFTHQARLYALCRRVGEGMPFDDDVVFAAAWVHDLGVFVGHRPETPEALARWDNTAYACAQAPALLRECGFPKAKIPAVVEAIRTHQPAGEPTAIEGVILRDADMLEQLGAAGILRTVSKVGRDTRFVVFADALRVLHRNAETLPSQIRLHRARELAAPRLAALRDFLRAAAAEAQETDW
jgi:uncharacterized protein